MTKTLRALIVILLLCVAAAAQKIQFTDATAAAGITFRHNNGAFGKKYLPETMGPGAAWLDYDGDGFHDLLLVNGTALVPGKTPPGTLRLYRNNKNGTFTDVSRAAGMAVSMYGLGAAVGDYDNDGRDDVFVTAMGQSRLFRNVGGKFTDATKAAGLEGPHEFSTSAAWVDYDKDGDLDLVVANYVQWSVATDIRCTMDGTNKSYCTPESYKGASARVWRNRGGRFEDATQKAGLLDASAKSLGVTIFDYNADGWPDIFLANDTQPNKLYQNNKNGAFTERAVMAGVAFSEDGVARAGMGVDAADYDRSGRESLIITNFSNQMMALYHNEGNGLFVDEAPRSEVGRNSLLTLGFATFFFDYDLDGWQDIFVANGHIENEIERIQKRVKFAQPPHLFRNDKGRFREVSASLGTPFNRPRVARGAAYADYDNDGDLDLVITTNGGPAVLLRNDGGTNNSVRIKLAGAKSNRNGLGAVVTVSAGGERQSQTLRSGSSYLSQSELVLTFGLGAHSAADAIEVKWPSGQVDTVRNVNAGQTVTIQEGKGQVGAVAYKKAAIKPAVPGNNR